TTKTGSMLNFDEFYRPLGKGATIGEALRDWFITRGSDGYQSWESSWFYGMTLLGDPTLRVSSAQGVDAETKEVRASVAVSLAAEPNPFRGSTTISFILGGKALENANLNIYDIAGRAVRSFHLGPAIESVHWDGTSSSGERLTYYQAGPYKVEMEGKDESQVFCVVACHVCSSLIFFPCCWHAHAS
ncbi:MAG: FlgD immunoglobulin-like domain containing protein, partial [bacterium]